MSVDSLPTDCFNGICLYLELADLSHLAACNKSLVVLCCNENKELWNLILCQKMWAVDPSVVLGDPEEASAEGVDSQAQFRKMMNADKDYRQYLDELKSVELTGWLECHFLGQVAPDSNGWERRFWSWSNYHSAFAAWEDDGRHNCYAIFPLAANCTVRRLSLVEQVTLSKNYHGDIRNPITTPKSYVFTISNTSLSMVWACNSERQLQTWLDKICVTLHPLQFEGRTYEAPARYLIQKKKPRL